MSLSSFFKSVSTLAINFDASSEGEAARLEWQGAAGKPFSRRVQIDSRESWGIVVIAPERVPIDKLVRVLEDESSYEARVVSSRAVLSGFELGLEFLGSGKRRATRVDVGGDASVETTAAADDETLRADVLNVSAGGLQLFAKSGLAAGETARIVGVGPERLCRVCYCLQIHNGYRIGLQFCD